jgi:hypothetical protein
MPKRAWIISRNKQPVSHDIARRKKFREVTTGDNLPDWIAVFRVRSTAIQRRLSLAILLRWIKRTMDSPVSFPSFCSMLTVT